MTSNDHFSKQTSFVYKPKVFWMIHHNNHFISKIHFIFKIMRLCVGSGFLVLHHRHRKPRHFCSLSPRKTMFDHNWRVFHPREGSISTSWYPAHIFFTISINHTTLLDVISFNRAHPINTNAVSIYQPCTYTHLIRCPCAYAMQLCHCQLYHVTYMMNVIWTI